jgi:transcriptional regulator GlxA family with amidase domain
MAETLPWSPHWEFGISHWQLETKLHYLSGKRKTCAGSLAAIRLASSRVRRCAAERRPGSSSK